MCLYIMYIITVLTVETNIVEIAGVFNDELDAQDNFLNKCAELSTRDDKSTAYECVMVSKCKCNISMRTCGWAYSTKVLHRIVTLHNTPGYINDTE